MPELFAFCVCTCSRFKHINIYETYALQSSSFIQILDWCEYELTCESLSFSSPESTGVLDSLSPYRLEFGLKRDVQGLNLCFSRVRCRLMTKWNSSKIAGASFSSLTTFSARWCTPRRAPSCWLQGNRWVRGPCGSSHLSASPYRAHQASRQCGSTPFKVLSTGHASAVTTPLKIDYTYRYELMWSE